jgi:DNA-binding HxlR family transcriptional regulator/predicted nucleotidyltransferase
MKFLVLSHLLLSGEKSIGELALLMGISNTYASQVTDALVEDGFAVKERRGKRVKVRPNMESPFVQSFSKFAMIVGAYPPYTPTIFLEPESRRRVIWHLRDGHKTIEDLKRETGYSRTVLYEALKPLVESGMVLVGGGKRKIYSINDASPLMGPLLQLIEFFESDIDLRPVLERISSDEKVVALSVFGSQVFGGKDRLSDVDVLVVVRSPEDRDIAEEYAHPRLQLNVYSRRGIVQLLKREPWFLELTLEGRILKGKDFLKGLVELPSDPDFKDISSEIKRMLADLDRLPDKEKARILMYCIRTAVAMKLFLNGELDQARFMEELNRGYPEFITYRTDVKKIDESIIKRSKKKILEDMRHAEEKEEKKR